LLVDTIFFPSVVYILASLYLENCSEVIVLRFVRLCKLFNNFATDFHGKSFLNQCQSVKICGSSSSFIHLQAQADLTSLGADLLHGRL
jgi:hypothetical protein